MEQKNTTLVLMSLLQIPRVGRKTAKKILNYIDPRNIKTYSDLYNNILNIDDKALNKYISSEIIKMAWEKAEKIIENSSSNDITIISYLDNKYPEILRKIDDYPILLHVKGNVDILSKECVAIIGSRKASQDGLKIGRKFAAGLSKSGYVIVSGLALGCDTNAHLGALDDDGFTVAVLAHGLHEIYPRENQKLANAILENEGALVSEYPFGVSMNKASFVDRDRIQSGLSLGTFVIETGVVGGSMHTVNFTKRQNRCLFALKPYQDNIIPTMLGNVKLLDEGAYGFSQDFDISEIIELLHKKKNELTSNSSAMYESDHIDSKIKVMEAKPDIKNKNSKKKSYDKQKSLFSF